MTRGKADKFSLQDLFSDDWTRRGTLDALARGGLGAFLAAAGIGSQAQAATDEVVRIGYLPITDASALLVAHARGLFEQQGLKAEAPTPVRSWSALIEGFAAGRFNVVHFLKPIPVWMRYNNKFPVKLLAWAHTNGSGLVVGAHTAAGEFKDLGGARIAVPFWYSMHNVVLHYALRKVGLKPVIKPDSEPVAAHEVALQVVPPTEMPPALAAKKIDGYIVAEPLFRLGQQL